MILGATLLAGWWFLSEGSDGDWGKVVRRSPPAVPRSDRANPAGLKSVRLGGAVLPWRRGPRSSPFAAVDIRPAVVPWRAVTGPNAFAAAVDLSRGDVPWTAADLPTAVATDADRPIPLFTATASLPSWPTAADVRTPATSRSALAVAAPALSGDEQAQFLESERLMGLRRERSRPTTQALQLADKLALPGLPRFVMALASAPDGAIWIGSEDEGVVRYDPATNTARQFKTRDGLGDDNAYALAIDHMGRVWAGHLNHGVSVYNGNPAGRWQNYEVVGGLSRPDTLNGPIGERVFAIKVCPADGDVWIATNCGLARYSETKRGWRYYTRADGLPSDEISSIAFDPAGNVYLGTQCDGIVAADAADEYTHWRVTRGPDAVPPRPAGEGLPTNRINDVLVTSQGTLYAATCVGLAWSTDRGATWRYTRGREWAEKVRQSEAGPPSGWQESPGAALAEDFCTTLAEDAVRGTLWVGHENQPVETIDLSDTGSLSPRPVGRPLYVTALLPPGRGKPARAVVGSYGQWENNLWLPPAVGTVVADVSAAIPARTPTAGEVPYPAPARPLTDADLLALGRQRPEGKGGPAAGDGPSVSLLADDWRTQGAWLGRYGRYWACLCAMDEYDYVWGATPKPLAYRPQIGLHQTGDDFIRRWRHLNYADTPQSLEIPCVYMDSRVKHGLTTWAKDRRQSDWDDHGEEYPLAFEGPDIYCTVNVPEGRFQLSLYEFNKDQHVLGSPFRYRDHTVSIYTRPPGSSLDFVGSTAGNTPPPAACTRVRQFWGGVYKRFAVRGPTVLTIKVSRDHSLNTILTAVMLDTFEQRPAPFAQYDRATNDDLASDSLSQKWGGVDFDRRLIYAGQQERKLRSNTSTPPSGNDTKLLMSDQFTLWQFAGWERLQNALGIKPVRQVERDLRWDGVRTKTKGEGYAIISEYLTHWQRASN